MEKGIVFLNWLLVDYVMLGVWSVAFVATLGLAFETRIRWLYLVAFACAPMILYFFWAWSGIWSYHETALAFNRTAQIATLFIGAMALKRMRDGLN